MWLICSLFGFFCAPGEAPGQDRFRQQQQSAREMVITGTATAIDGDSLRINSTEIRLQAIDAPEMSQKCGETGREWPCGLAARRRVIEIIAGQEVTCRADLAETHDRFGRFLGFCITADGVAINREMVASGYARAFTRYIAGKPHQKEFEEAEAEAARLRRGVWAGPHVAPWDFRAAAREGVDPQKNK